MVYKIKIFLSELFSKPSSLENCNSYHLLAPTSSWFNRYAEDSASESLKSSDPRDGVGEVT